MSSSDKNKRTDEAVAEDDHEARDLNESDESDRDVSDRDEDGPSDTEEASAKPAPSPVPRDERTNKESAGWRGAPGWVVPVYLAGLILVYAGQRALSALETGASVLTGVGVAVAVLATLVRFSPKFGATGERGSIESLMRGLSILGLAALAVYAATTDWGQETVGLATQDLDARERSLGILNVVWLSLLLIATLPMLFAEWSLRPMRRAERPESRRIRAAAAAGLALALAAVYGSLFVFSADALEVKVDYSYFKTSGPSEGTKKMAQDLEDQVQVTAFFPEVNEVKSEVQGYLSELSKAAPKLKVEMTDRLLEPKKARDLRATQDGTLVLSKGKVTRAVLVGTEMDSSRAKLKTLDRDFQAALLKLARARRTVYMTVGHGELNDKSGEHTAQGRSAEILTTLLRKQNYTVKDLGLAQGLGNQLPDDADVVMVLGPSEPFAEAEVQTLKNYVMSGGKLLLALDPDAISTFETVKLNAAKPDSGDAAQVGTADPAPPPVGSASPAASEPTIGEAEGQASTDTPGTEQGFGPLLKAVGLSYSPTILANETKHVRRRFNDSDRVMLVTSNFSSHASVSTLSRNAPRAAIVASGAGSLEAVESSADKRPNKIDFAVRAAPDTFQDLDRDYQRDKGSENAKGFNLAAAISKQLGKSSKKKDDKPAKSAKQDKDENDPLDDLNEYRMFVMSDADALSDLVMANVAGNQFLFVDAVRWLGGEESWSGEQTTEEDVRITHTKKEDQVWFYSTIFGAPALVLGAGVFISRRSRQRGQRKGAKS